MLWALESKNDFCWFSIGKGRNQIDPRTSHNPLYMAAANLDNLKTDSYQGVSWVESWPISFCCDGMFKNYLTTKCVSKPWHFYAVIHTGLTVSPVLPLSGGTDDDITVVYRSYPVQLWVWFVMAACRCLINPYLISYTYNNYNSQSSYLLFYIAYKSAQ